MDILTELKKQLEKKDDFFKNGPSADAGQEWLSRTKELLAKVDHGMAVEFDELGRRSALPLSSLTLDPILSRMAVILRNAIHHIELAEPLERVAQSSLAAKVGQNLGENIHKKYWGLVLSGFKNFIFFTHRKSSFTVGFVLVLIILTYLGYAKYIPDFNFPIGTFKVEGVSPKVPGAGNTDSGSKILDRSVFDLSKETIATGLTSQERVNLIEKISNLETRKEAGTVEDIGTDGLTLVIVGKSSDGFIGHVSCDFTSSWKQRISLLKKGSEIKFVGIVSMYDLAYQWISLKNCKIPE